MTIESGSGSHVSGPIKPTASAEAAAVQNQMAALLLFDSIAPSTAVGGGGPLQAGAPQLTSPQDFAAYVALQMDAVTTNMLNAWSNQVAAQAEAAKEELKSPAYLAWAAQNSASAILQAPQINEAAAAKNGSQVEAMTVSNQSRYEGLDAKYSWDIGLSSLLALTVQNIQNNQAIPSDPNNDKVNQDKNMVNLTAGLSGTQLPAPDNYLAAQNIPANPPAAEGPLGQKVNPTLEISGANVVTSGHNPLAAGLAASSLVIGIGFVSQFQNLDVANTSQASQIDVKIYQDAWQAVASSQDPATYAAGWLSARWGVGLANFVSAQEVGETGKAPGKPAPKDLDFAKSFAQAALITVNGNQFNAGIMALVTPMIQQSPESREQDPNVLALKAKLVLLSLSLGMVYKLELKTPIDEGKITGEEFAAMLTGEMDVTKNDPFQTAGLKQQLIAQIRVFLVQLPPTERARLLEGLMAFFDTNPSVDHMLDSPKVVSSIFSQEDLEEPLDERRI